MHAKGPPDRERLVAEHLSFVRAVAARVKEQLPKTIEFDDLVSYGTQGLLEAAERFDGRHGASFSTFAYYRIRGAIYDGLRRMGWLPRGEYARTRAEERAGAYLGNLAERDAGALAFGGEEAGGRSLEDEVAELADALGGVAAIFVTALTAEDTESLLDQSPAAHERIELRQINEAVRAAIATLPEKERRLVELYYFEEKTLEEAGAMLGLSKSWSSRLHARAIDLMQSELRVRSAAPPPPAATGKRSPTRR